MEEKMKYVLSPYDSNTLDDDIIFYKEKYVLDLEQQLQAYKDIFDELRELIRLHKYNRNTNTISLPNIEQILNKEEI